MQNLCTEYRVPQYLVEFIGLRRIFEKSPLVSFPMKIRFRVVKQDLFDPLTFGAAIRNEQELQVDILDADT